MEIHTSERARRINGERERIEFTRGAESIGERLLVKDDYLS